MTTKIIKEIIIMLLTCLAGLLLFAVIFYEYIPSRKVVPEIAQYSASDNIKELIADDIDKRDEKIIKTFEVTSSDLTNYKITHDYVAGKSNPFGSAKTNPDAGSTTKKNDNTVDTNSSKENNVNTTNEENKNETNETENETIVTIK